MYKENESYLCGLLTQVVVFVLLIKCGVSGFSGVPASCGILSPSVVRRCCATALVMPLPPLPSSGVGSYCGLYCIWDEKFIIANKQSLKKITLVLMQSRLDFGGFIFWGLLNDLNWSFPLKWGVTLIINGNSATLRQFRCGLCCKFSVTNTMNKCQLIKTSFIFIIFKTSK